MESVIRAEVWNRGIGLAGLKMTDPLFTRQERVLNCILWVQSRHQVTPKRVWDSIIAEMSKEFVKQSPNVLVPSVTSLV